MRCDQVDDLLSLGVELKEKIERLSSIRESDKEIDQWDQALASFRQERPPARNHDQESLLYLPPV